MSGYSDLNWEVPKIKTYPGTPYPLGAYYDGHGINFALYSEYATKVYLCLFRPSHDEKQQLIEYARINMKGNTFIESFIQILKYLFRTNSPNLAYLST
jgi:glycogen operon protein